MDIIEIRKKLPLPSECEYNIIKVPFMYNEFDGTMVLNKLGQVTFEKYFFKGICIGWKLKK